MPYYIASLNIEHGYYHARMRRVYERYEGIWPSLTPWTMPKPLQRQSRPVQQEKTAKARPEAVNALRPSCSWSLAIRHTTQGN